jgi:hypothetical protein
MNDPAGRTYLTSRGMFPATIAELAPVYLTPTPDAAECDAYKQYLREPRTDSHGEPLKVLDGLIIPIQTIAEPFKPFGRQRIITPTADLTAYYAKKGEDVPKFLSPSKARLKDQPGLHLFTLPHDAAKLGKSKDVICLCEAEVKAAVVSQWLRLLDDDTRQYVSIGAGGVNMFVAAPEWAQLPLKDRPVYLFFDADGFNKREVMQAEIRLTLACLAKGARAVRTVVWNPADGKGIDDYLVRQPCPLATLKTLLAQAVSVFTKYAAPPFAGLLPYPLDSLCAEIAKQPVKPFLRSMIAHDLAQAYKAHGITVTDVRRELDAARQRRRAYEQAQRPVSDLQKEFGLEFTPQFPDNFEPIDGKLCYKEFALCHQFVVAKYVYTESPDSDDTYQLAFQGKSLLIPSDVQSNYKRLAAVFNRNREILFDGSAKMIQQYISQFYLKNHDQIPKTPLYENTGWNRDGFFQLPDITDERNAAVYPPDLVSKFTPRGERAEQYALHEEMLTRHQAGLLDVIGFAAPCLALLNLPRYAVAIYGSPGSGKTKACEIAISIYGDPEQLLFTMDTTKVGKEITFALYRDLPIVLDEFNTASPDGKKIAQNVIETIYGFAQGKGRTRATVQIRHREVAEFRGLVLMTSERSLESIFSVAQNIRVGGAYRRTLEIPVIDEKELWNIEIEADKSETQFFARLHATSRQHYGHLGIDWLTHLADKDVVARLLFEYDTALNMMLEGGLGNLKGTEKLIALLWAVMKELEFFLNLSGTPILNNLRQYLTAITERQQRQIDEQIADEAERFKENLETFIAMHITCFDNICPERAVMAQVFGKVEYSDSLTHVYLMAGIFKAFCNEYGFERDTLLPKLEARGMFRRDDGQPYKQMSIANAKGKAYHFVLNSQDTGFLHDLHTTTAATTPRADSSRPASRDSRAAPAPESAAAAKTRSPRKT